MIRFRNSITCRRESKFQCLSFPFELSPQGDQNIILASSHLRIKVLTEAWKTLPFWQRHKKHSLFKWQNKLRHELTVQEIMSDLKI